MAGTSMSNKTARGGRGATTKAAMANNKKKLEESSTIPMDADKSLSLGDAFLFAMLCIVGMPVEVQVRDGSVYSGVFHTADASSGVVLRKAKKITDGKRSTNVPLGSFVDSLVILSEDFVQIVVKDFALPSEKSIKNLNNPAQTVEKVNNESSKTSIKESKLNPSARSFSPAIPKPRPAPPVISSPPDIRSSPVVGSSPVGNQFYIPSIKTSGSPPVVPNFGTYSIVPNHRPFITEKPILYNNSFVPTNGAIPIPFPQPILGCENTRGQPIGVVNQFRPVNFAPNYLTPNPSTVLAPRPSPVMCVHPITQGAIQGPTLVSNPMLNPYQTTLQKFQGPPPICMTPQLVLNPNRPLMVPNPIQFAHNFGPFRPIIVPNGPGYLPTNFA
ncbi:hypothetical protein LUZ60_009094 [Juncus effusus]|nr:hypothetical protein LUZ60_009094 [Juncus effusus]